MIEMNNISFEERCEIDPQGLIKDLVAQTTRQAKAIHDVNLKLKKLQGEYDKLKKQVPEE